MTTTALASASAIARKEYKRAQQMQQSEFRWSILGNPAEDLVLTVIPHTPATMQIYGEYLCNTNTLACVSRTKLHIEIPPGKEIFVLEKINAIYNECLDHIAGILVLRNNRVEPVPMVFPPTATDTKSSPYISFEVVQRMDRLSIPDSFLQELETAVFCGKHHSKRVTSLSWVPPAAYYDLKAKGLYAQMHALVELHRSCPLQYVMQSTEEKRILALAHQNSSLALVSSSASSSSSSSPSTRKRPRPRSSKKRSRSRKQVQQDTESDTDTDNSGTAEDREEEEDAEDDDNSIVHASIPVQTQDPPTQHPDPDPDPDQDPDQERWSMLGFISLSDCEGEGDISPLSTTTPIYCQVGHLGSGSLGLTLDNASVGTYTDSNTDSSAATVYTDSSAAATY